MPQRNHFGINKGEGREREDEQKQQAQQALEALKPLFNAMEVVKEDLDNYAEIARHFKEGSDMLDLEEGERERLENLAENIIFRAEEELKG